MRWVRRMGVRAEEELELGVVKEGKGTEEEDDDARVHDTRQLQQQQPTIKSSLLPLLTHPPTQSFFLLVLLLGLSSGLIENFAYVRLREVGGTGRDMGICCLFQNLTRCEHH